VFGSNSVTLTQGEMPAHGHTLTAYNQPTAASRTSTPAANNFLGIPTLSNPFIGGQQPNVQFAPAMCGPAGGGQPHENRQPYLASNFCIALQGIFPSFP
jgi:microcystin-dependent protein